MVRSTVDRPFAVGVPSIADGSTGAVDPSRVGWTMTSAWVSFTS